MKHLLYILALLLSTISVSAQTVKTKKDIVYVDSKPTFSYAKKAMGNEIYIYKLNTNEELFSMSVDNNGTEHKADDGKKIIFSKQNTTIQSKIFRERDWDFLIALLIQDKVIDLNGAVDSDNLKRFKPKYDDKNINHTNRY